MLVPLTLQQQELRSSLKAPRYSNVLEDYDNVVLSAQKAMIVEISKARWAKPTANHPMHRVGGGLRASKRNDRAKDARAEAHEENHPGQEGIRAVPTHICVR